MAGSVRRSEDQLKNSQENSLALNFLIGGDARYIRKLFYGCNAQLVRAVAMINDFRKVGKCGQMGGHRSRDLHSNHFHCAGIARKAGGEKKGRKGHSGLNSL